jgi:hypothetical protein
MSSHLSFLRALKFSGRPLVPHESDYDDLHLMCGGTADCDFGHYDTELVLLDQGEQGEQGSLDTCEQDPRCLPQPVRHPGHHRAAGCRTGAEELARALARRVARAA